MGTGTAVRRRMVRRCFRAWVFWFRQQRTPENKISLWGPSQPTSRPPPSSHPPPTTSSSTSPCSAPRRSCVPCGGGVLRGVGRRAWRRVRTARVGRTTTRRRGRTVRVGEDAGDTDVPEICDARSACGRARILSSLWNRVDDARVRERIRDTLRTVLGLPAGTVMEYKSNNGACILSSLYLPSFCFLFAVFHFVWGSWIAAEVAGFSWGGTPCFFGLASVLSCSSSGPVLAGSFFSHFRIAPTPGQPRLVGSGRDAECCFVVFFFSFLAVGWKKERGTYLRGRACVFWRLSRSLNEGVRISDIESARVGAEIGAGFWT
ncbi:hypothetical protein B0H14DRAFT_3548233 [Mycena olivaceomarginata]|nr:hypothetical protein B0H14DRAFT_3548233 [Mycena olivaceomarginata]